MPQEHQCLGRYASRTAPGSTATGWLPPGRCSAGPIDVLTGDYLAELTMLILWKARQKGPRPRLRGHVPAAAGGGARHLPGARRQGRRQRGRPQPRGSRREDHRALRPARPEHPRRLHHRRRPDPGPRRPAGRGPRAHQPRHRAAAGQGGPAGGHRQRLPGRLGHHRRAAGGRGRGRLPPGHRREPGHRARRLVARLAPRRLGRPGRGGRRRARDRVRPAGDRRQLQLPGRDHQSPLPRIPDRRGRRGRRQRHHQARRHRRRRLGRVPSPPSCSTRSATPPTSTPTSSRTSTPSGWRRTARTGSR